MTDNCCLLCGHHEAWHVLSGPCFCDYYHDESVASKFIKKPCWCPNFTTDWKEAQRVYKEIKGNNIMNGTDNI